jgi:hypothetical protein
LAYRRQRRRIQKKNKTNQIRLLDIFRGFAILGILGINIWIFAYLGDLNYRIASEKTHGLNRGLKTSVGQERGFITLLSNAFLKTYLQTYIRMVNYHKLHILDSLKCENQAVELSHTVIEPWGSRG